MPDEYQDDSYRWWHLSRPSPELVEVVGNGWLDPPGRVLDLGCGLGTELAYLSGIGYSAFGVDLSHAALATARALHPPLQLTIADVRALPYRSSAFDYLIDRGTYHYMRVEDRSRYASEAARILRVGGRFLLRACMQSQGAASGVDVATIHDSFEGWSISSLVVRDISSDTRSMPALIVCLERR